MLTGLGYARHTNVYYTKISVGILNNIIPNITVDLHTKHLNTLQLLHISGLIQSLVRITL